MARRASPNRTVEISSTRLGVSDQHDLVARAAHFDRLRRGGKRANERRKLRGLLLRHRERRHAALRPTDVEKGLERCTMVVGVGDAGTGQVHCAAGTTAGLSAMTSA